MGDFHAKCLQAIPSGYMSSYQSPKQDKAIAYMRNVSKGWVTIRLTICT